MKSLVLYNIGLSFVPGVDKTAIVEYKVKDAPDSTYIVWSSSVSVLTNGDFSPAIDITGLDESLDYVVRVTLDCGGPSFVFTFSDTYATTTSTSTTSTSTTTTSTTTSTTTTTLAEGFPCNSYTVYHNIKTFGDELITWTDCEGVNQSHTIHYGDGPIEICSLEPPTGTFNYYENGPCDDNNIVIHSDLSGVYISDVIGISGYTFPDTTHSYNINIFGHHNIFTGSISVTIVGTPVIDGHLDLTYAGTILECINVPTSSSGTNVYTFSSYSFSDLSLMRIDLSTGTC